MAKGSISLLPFLSGRGVTGSRDSLGSYWDVDPSWQMGSPVRVRVPPPAPPEYTGFSPLRILIPLAAESVVQVLVEQDLHAAFSPRRGWANSMRRLILGDSERGEAFSELLDGFAEVVAADDGVREDAGAADDGTAGDLAGNAFDEFAFHPVDGGLRCVGHWDGDL